MNLRHPEKTLIKGTNNNLFIPSLRNTRPSEHSVTITFEVCAEFNSSKKMMEWLRCNFCWVKVESQAQPFHLTQCGHIYCSKCVGKAIKRCFQCGTMDTIALPLKEPLSPQIEHYFQNSADLLDKVTSAQKFQEAQLTLCLQRGDAADAKYQALKEAYWKNNENLKKLNEKYTRLKMMVVAMQQEQKKKAAPARYTLPSMTPMNQVKQYEHNQVTPHSRNHQRDSSMRNDGVFRVPSLTRVPRSAGYYSGSASSNSSSRGIYTPSSNYSS